MLQYNERHELTYYVVYTPTTLCTTVQQLLEYPLSHLQPVR